jgi:serine/threonine protein kinase
MDYEINLAEKEARAKKEADEYALLLRARAEARTKARAEARAKEEQEKLKSDKVLHKGSTAVEAAGGAPVKEVGVRDELLNSIAIREARGIQPTRIALELGNVGASGAQHEGLLTNAMDLFSQNATFRVLTNSSISCITLLGTWEDSNLINTRLPRRYIKNLLFKFFLVREGDRRPRVYHEVKGRGKQVEVQHQEEFREEISRQVNAYNRMYTMTTDPCVPNIILAESNLADNKFGNYKTSMLNLYKSKLYEQAEKTQFNNFFDNDYKVSLCVMEYMDGYMTISDYLANRNPYISQNVFRKYIQLELLFLICCGIVHVDYHDSNIMINPNMPNYYGKDVNFKIIILDFGRASDIPPVDLNGIVRNTREYLNYAISKFIIVERLRYVKPEIEEMLDICNKFIEFVGKRHQLFRADATDLESYKRLKPYLDLLGRKTKKRGRKTKKRSSNKLYKRSSNKLYKRNSSKQKKS